MRLRFHLKCSHKLLGDKVFTHVVVNDHIAYFAMDGTSGLEKAMPLLVRSVTFWGN